MCTFASLHRIFVNTYLRNNTSHHQREIVKQPILLGFFLFKWNMFSFLPNMYIGF